MALREIDFSSYNGRDTIKGWIYTPMGEPRGVVQIVHGYAEHSRRYLHLIGTLLENGLVVCADDHAAHGKTAHDGNTWGDPGDKGHDTYIEDEHTLRTIATKDYAELPYIMFGHSWGSMIARGYAIKHGDGVAAMIWCGLCAQLKGADKLAASGDVRAAVAAGKGKENGMKYQNRLFANMTDRYPNPNGPSDWIARNPDVVADHASDPFNNLNNPPTVQLVHDFVELYAAIEAGDWAGRVPQDMPIHIIAGDNDPCGNYGEGVYHVANQLALAGHGDVSVVCYPGERHEIYNEPHLRDAVEEGIVEFINTVVDDAAAEDGCGCGHHHHH